MLRERLVSQPVTGSGALLQVIRQGRATTRAELIEVTGLARSTVAQRLDLLRARDLIVDAGENPSTGGRPPAVFAFNQNAGLVLVADLGVTHCRLAVADLAGRPLIELATDLEIAKGPEHVLTWVRDRFVDLVDRSGRNMNEVRGIGIGVPGPVEFATGQAVHPPIMPGWDGFSIPNWFSRYHDEVPVLVDNDVNIMAIGEHWMHWRDAAHLLFVKVGSGIGCGIVAGGTIHRGAQGAAGDIGHIQVTDREDATCHCGNVGCLEAVAGGLAMARALTGMGIPAATSRDVVKLARGGNRDAAMLVREAGRALGQVLAAAVNLVNPGVIVIGGDVAHAHEQLLAGVREELYRRSLPLATRHLRIARSELEDRAGVIGAAVMVIEHILSPDAVDRALATGA
ncbi:ROK family protein [Pendulispora rubella]|uniref:ROK family protein n=2 Tax=Pendulispora rubella TaxID=2741070 RepID=A0ABZ2L3M3_9BACT